MPKDPDFQAAWDPEPAREFSKEKMRFLTDEEMKNEHAQIWSHEKVREEREKAKLAGLSENDDAVILYDSDLFEDDQGEKTALMTPAEMVQAAGLKGDSGQTELLDVAKNIEKGAQMVDSVLDELDDFVEKAKSGALTKDEIRKQSTSIELKTKQLLGVAQRDQFPAHLKAEVMEYAEAMAEIGLGTEAGMVIKPFMRAANHLNNIVSILETPEPAQEIAHVQSFYHETIERVMQWFK